MVILLVYVYGTIPFEFKLFGNFFHKIAIFNNTLFAYGSGFNTRNEREVRTVYSVQSL